MKDESEMRKNSSFLVTNENLSLLLLLLESFRPSHSMGKVIKLMDFRLDSFSITKYEHEHEKSKKKKIKERRDALSVSLLIRK